ncbi:MAG: hypothetical protein ACLTXP_12920 [Odoribacter splanchnicus]
MIKPFYIVITVLSKLFAIDCCRGCRLRDIRLIERIRITVGTGGERSVAGSSS